MVQFNENVCEIESFKGEKFVCNSLWLRLT